VIDGEGAMPFPRSLRRVTLSTALAVALAGCRGYQSPGKNHVSSESWTKNLHAADNSLRATGLDPKARDVERSLGVQ
jgi:hypothetical protein